MKATKQPKIVRYVRIPSVPNFILGSDGEYKYSIKDFSDNELKVIGRLWIEALIDRKNELNKVK